MTVETSCQKAYYYKKVTLVFIRKKVSNRFLLHQKNSMKFKQQKSTLKLVIDVSKLLVSHNTYFKYNIFKLVKVVYLFFLYFDKYSF